MKILIYRRFSALAVLAALLFNGHLSASPSWWSDPAKPVLDPLAAVQHHAAANVGQGKWTAYCALLALEDALGVSHPTCIAIRAELLKASEMSSTGVFFPDRPASPSPEWLSEQKGALQVGALKALAAPFYRHLGAEFPGWVEDQLNNNGLTTLGTDYFADGNGVLFPWNPADDQNSEKNGSLANIGQLMVVFALDFATLPTNSVPELLTLPSPNQIVKMTDGVVFTFGLDGLTTLPERVLIYRRVDGSWTAIGKLTEFGEFDGVRSLRGSVVWVPDAPGTYELKAEAFDAADELLAASLRTVSVEVNGAPTVQITGVLGNPPNPSANPVNMSFETTVSDPDGDEVARVEFFDNGVFIGSDTEAPFGDVLVDRLGISSVFQLLKGTHSITAKAFDSKRTEGAVSAPLSVQVTGGNSRPEIQVSAPLNGQIIQKGQSFTVSYTAQDPDVGDTVDSVTVETGSFSQTWQAGITATIDTSSWEAGAHLLKLVAIDGNLDESYPAYVTVYIEDIAQPGFAATLAQRIADGTTATVSNPVFAGAEVSSGIFTGGVNAGLDIETGVLLTTGKFSWWNAGDFIENAPDQEAVNGFPGIDDLTDRVAGTATFDATLLEVDVFCSNSQLEMEVQFGSEEYIEWVSDLEGGCKNDAFLVLVDGVAVSLVPNSVEILAVNNVHPYIAGQDSNCHAVQTAGGLGVPPLFEPAPMRVGVVVGSRCPSERSP